MAKEERHSMNVYQKLNEARAKFHQSQLKKSGHNKFANYYYFELGDFIIPALDIFHKVGLTGVVTFGTEVAHISIIDNDKPEDRIIISSPMSTAALKGCHEVQNLGAVQTYLRRYLWVAALEIVEHDALDSTVKGMDDSELMDWIAAIDATTTADELKAVYAKAYAAAKNDIDAQKRIVAAKDRQKAKL
jgi:hypothetical protein